jgi:hypothetical protein
MGKRRNGALRPQFARRVVPETPGGVPFDASFRGRDYRKLFGAPPHLIARLRSNIAPESVVASV